MFNELKETMVKVISKAQVWEQKWENYNQKWQKMRKSLQGNEQHTRELRDEFTKNSIKIIRVPEKLKGKSDEEPPKKPKMRIPQSLGVQEPRFRRPEESQWK